MKVERPSISDSIIVFASVLFVVLSFADLYTVTSVGSAIDRETGEFLVWSEKIKNTGFSVACSVIPPISTFINKRWIRILSIVTGIINILYMTVAYPILVMASGMICEQKSAGLTIVGWTEVCVVFLITVLLIFKEYHHKKNHKRLQGGSAKK